MATIFFWAAKGGRPVVQAGEDGLRGHGILFGEEGEAHFLEFAAPGQEFGVFEAVAEGGIGLFDEPPHHETEGDGLAKFTLGGGALFQFGKDGADEIWRGRGGA